MAPALGAGADCAVWIAERRVSERAPEVPWSRAYEEMSAAAPSAPTSRIVAAMIISDGNSDSIP